MRRFLLSCAVLAGCSWRPARYLDAPPATAVGDDRPIHRPVDHELPELVWFSENYLRRPVLEALDPERVRDAGDVNALDEVPRSSWHRPSPLDVTGFERSFAPDGPPAAPLSIVPGRVVTLAAGVRVRDARGRSWELGRDHARFPRARTAAAAIAARLAHALGYPAPETHVVELGPGDLGGSPDRLGPFLAEGPPSRRGRWRVVAVRWPDGVDVGTPPADAARRDDPNDRVEHRDRRTLRALGVLGAWLSLDVSPANTRDVWTGRPGRQHLVHHLVRLDAALGSTRWEPRHATESAAGQVSGGFFENLVTLGLRPEPPDPVPDGPQPLARLELAPADDAFRPRRSYEPIDRCLDADAYWLAKRIVRVPAALVRHAVGAGRLGDAGAEAALSRAIVARGRAIARKSFRRTTPLEPERAGRGVLLLRDEAVLRGLEGARTTRHRVAYFDAEGAEIARGLEVLPRGPRVAVPVPPGQGYVVVRVTALRDSAPAQRSCELHVVRDARGTRLVGVRH